MDGVLGVTYRSCQEAAELSSSTADLTRTSTAATAACQPPAGSAGRLHGGTRSVQLDSEPDDDIFDGRRLSCHGYGGRWCPRGAAIAVKSVPGHASAVVVGGGVRRCCRV